MQTTPGGRESFRSTSNGKTTMIGRKDSPTPKHVIVIGGGVIGAFSAYYLNRAGHAVTIVERGEFGRGCSHANCGLISPSHVLPLAAPGAIGATMRAMLRPN